MAQRCWRLTWPTRPDRVLKTELQSAHMQLKGLEVDCIGNGEGEWRWGENAGRDGEEEALE